VDTLHLSIESSILGSHHSSILFLFFAMGQSNWLIVEKKKKKKKKKSWTCKAPQLINMKQNNKNPQNKHPFFSSFLTAPRLI
jgi:hypothetical protein